MDQIRMQPYLGRLILQYHQSENQQKLDPFLSRFRQIVNLELLQNQDRHHLG